MLKTLTAALAALVLFTATPALAGEWFYCWGQAALANGGNLGDATRVAGSNYTFMNMTPGQFATGEFIIPDYLTTLSLTATGWGRINSTTTSNEINLTITCQTSTAANANSTPDTNFGDAAVGGLLTGHPFGTANTEVTVPMVSGTIACKNQATGSVCGTVATCANAPSIMKVIRSTGGAEDGAAFQLNKLCIYGTTP